MDSSMLDLILADPIYSFTHREAFIDSITDLFDQFKELGDENLLISEFGPIYEVIGNHSNVKILMKIEGNVKDIEFINVVDERVSFQLWIEDRIDFSISDEQLIKLSKAAMAIKDLRLQRILQIDFIQDWLFKHSDLNTGWLNVKRTSKLKIFNEIYLNLQSISDGLDHTQDAIKACNDYSEDDFLNWMIKYEVLAIEKLNEFNTYFKNPNLENDTIQFKKNIYFRLSDISPLLKFIELFDKHYFGLIRKE
jgi:hypothetical protein